MVKDYTEQQLRNIAGECQEFEHVITAMGYGYSLLNVSPSTYARRCADCIHWLEGSCNIFRKELSQYD